MTTRRKQSRISKTAQWSEQPKNCCELSGSGV